MKERQLNETRHICRLAAQYLRPVCGQVQVTKGQATAMVRSHWGLMKAMSGSSAKTRDDLRHHAVDAVAVAFTSLSLFNQVTRIRKAAMIDPLSDQTVPPAPVWLHHQLKERLRTVVISHEATRAITDAFHKETAMGLRNRAEGVYHFRKPLVAMTEGEIREIVDPKVRALAIEAFEASERNAKLAFANGLRIGKKDATRARIAKKLPKSPMMAVPKAAPEKYFELGNNHHVEIFENEEGKRKARYVTTLEAAERVRPRRGQRATPIVDTTPPAPGWRFVTWLAPNDMIRVPDDDREFFRLESIWATNNRLCFRHHIAATQNDNDQRLLKSTSLLSFVKLEVDPIGRVREVREGVV